MKRSIFYITCVFFILLQCTGSYAQQGGGAHGRSRRGGQNAPGAPAIVVKATVDHQQIVIGQPVHLLLEATVPGNEPLIWPILDSLHHFDLLERGRRDTIARSGEIYYTENFTITSFDSGSWQIPSIPFQSGTNLYFTDSVRIDVGYSKFDPNQDFHDIKDIIDIPNPYARWIPWIIAAVTLISLLLVVWLVRKKKLLHKLIPGLAGPVLSPYEDAIRQLDELEKHGFGDSVQVKILYTRLSEVLRMYLHRQLNVRSLAETSEELIREMRPLPLDPAAFDQLADTLRLSDFVKFAKYQPGVTDNERSYRVIRDAIEKLNRAGNEEKNEETQGKPVVRGKDNMPMRG